jgi:hypothetical protein
MKAMAVFVFLLITSVVPSNAQESLPLVKMKDVAMLVGQWRGEGWIQFEEGERRSFTVTERVESRLGGLVLVFDRTAEGDAAGREGPTVINHAFGILTYDAVRNRYAGIVIRDDGSYVVAEVKQDQGFLEWSYDDPELGTVKNLIRITESGEWYGVGENSKDEVNWNRTYEMHLTRQD